MDSPYMTRSVHSVSHEASFRDALSSINQAAQNALPSKKGYDCVRVLTLRWANDDLGLADIERELLEFFSVEYHFATDSILISSLSMPDALDNIREKIGKLIKYDTPTTLFVAVYEGHSCITDKGFTLYGSRRYTPAIPWLMIEGELTRTLHADKLPILDSCFSTAATIEGGNNEYLATSSSESQTSGCVERSFTRRFLDLLARIDCPEITVAQIHAKLVTLANKPNSKHDYTPLHYTSIEKPSITLRSLHKMPREVAALRRTGGLADGKVLISVLLEEKPSIPKIEEWKRWLMASVPDAVADIKQCGWDMLKRSDAYAFVAYVESHNLLLGQPNASNALESRAGNVQLPTWEK
ncbi:hypothetical protein BDV24DRAFT_157615 [Aspergillus arachidicola]|uniref:Uncharacterized protein n=1 Tax=Aspergillus arachidicola TaxID=656916 RepID=A0A5N6YUM4_9EURO|nr:hypothetical protein BDV24DRAFT_157615 [Aspergillus arachidicola]